MKPTYLTYTDKRSIEELNQKMPAILSKSAGIFEVDERDIMTPCKRQDIADARAYAMWQCSKLGYNHTVIGSVFKRDRSTASFAIQKINNLIKVDKRFAQLIGCDVRDDDQTKIIKFTAA